MHFPECIVILFDTKIYSKDYESDLEDEVIEMHVDLEAKAFLKGKNLAEY